MHIFSDLSCFGLHRRERSAVVMTLALALLLGGTVGFTMIEGLELLDALYLSAAIVSTVGELVFGVYVVVYGMC